MPNYDYSAIGASLGIFLVIGIASLILGIIIWWRIFSKAGYSGAMSLLLFVPIANLIVLCVLAFGEWPIYKELNYLRQQAARNQPYPPFGNPLSPPPGQYPSYPQPQYPGQTPQYPSPYPQSSNPQYPNYRQPQG